MTFFDVEDGEGGSIEDRIAIIAVVAFAFCWIPIFVIWKCISVVRRKNDNPNGNLPVTTHDGDPEKYPHNPEEAEAEPGESTVSPARDEQRQNARNAGSRQPSRDVDRSSRGDHHHHDARKTTKAPNSRRSPDSVKTPHPKHASNEHHSSSKRHQEHQGLRSSKRVTEVADTDAPSSSRRRSSQHHDEGVHK